MKILKKLPIVLALLFVSVVPVATIKAEAAVDVYKGNPTGYKKASDVEYVKSGSYIANWGAREEDCVFLSTYAQNFYTGSNTYENFVKNQYKIHYFGREYP